MELQELARTHLATSVTRRQLPVGCIQIIGSEVVKLVFNAIVVSIYAFRLNITSEVVDNGTKSRLKLKGAERSDSGEFLCTSKNEFGHSTRHIKLFVRGDLVPPTLITFC